MAIVLLERPYVSEGATRRCAVDFTDDLRDSELLTGTPTAAEQTTSDLTISDVQRNTAAITIKGVSVAIDNAVTFLVSGQNAGTEYTVRVTCGTDATDAQTLEYDVKFDCV